MISLFSLISYIVIINTNNKRHFLSYMLTLVRNFIYVIHFLYFISKKITLFMRTPFQCLFKKWYAKKMILCRSLPDVFWKKVVFKNFAKFKGKHSCQSLRLQIFLKRDSVTGAFLWILTKFLRTPFFVGHLGWVVLFIKGC